MFGGFRDIGNKIESIVKPKGYHIVRQYTGHGIDQRVGRRAEGVASSALIFIWLPQVPLQPQYCALRRIQDPRKDGGWALLHNRCVDLILLVVWVGKLMISPRDVRRAHDQHRNRAIRSLEGRLDSSCQDRRSERPVRRRCAVSFGLFGRDLFSGR